MILLTVEDILNSTQGRLLKGKNNNIIDNIVIDSREANENSLFIAIKGESQDGHKYIQSAYKLGCKNFIISDEMYISDDIEESNIVLVTDTEIAMGDIARHYMTFFDIPIIGVTGSVGKTTTRDMVYSVVSRKFKTLKNEKNYNNQFGVPLTVFNLDKSHECAVIEMGMCGLGEIDYLANIVKPNIAVISNIGTSHIELLGSQENIFKAKMEITNYFNQNSRLIVNGDDLWLYKVFNKSNNSYCENEDYSVYSFGKASYNTIFLKKYKTIENTSTFFTVHIDGDDVDFEIPTMGEHNVYNAMSAILVGLNLKMSIEEIRLGLLDFKPTKDRQNIVKTDEFVLINDVYNASPDSMVASLKVLSLYKNRRVAILGDCLEMGSFAEIGHRRVGRESIGKVDLLVTIGEDSEFIGIEAMEKGFDLSKVFHFKNKEDAILYLPKILKKEDVILLKASRGMHFEEVVEYLEGGIKC